jgi:MFS family permease
LRRRYSIPHETIAARVPREVAALLAALQFRDAETEGLQRLSEEEWRSLLRFCEHAHLTFPLAQIRVDEAPAWVAEQLQRNIADNALRFERVKVTYREAAQALEDAGVDHIVIKGFTQAPGYVADPRLRMQSDIDFVCRPEQIALAQSALEAIGYQSDQQGDTRNDDHTPTMTRRGDWQWRGNIFDPAMPHSVELHFCLWNEDVSLVAIPETERFFARRTRRVLDGLEFFALSPEDHLGHLALHIARNLMLRNGIVHHVYELATFLDAHSDDDAFWASWQAKHSASLRAKEAIAFFHAAAWFECDLHPAVEDQIAALPKGQLEWLSHFTWSALEGMFHPNKDSVWLHLELLEGTKKKMVLLRRSFLPQVTTRLGSYRVAVQKGKIGDPEGKHPYRRYASYLVSRSLDHARMDWAALGRGIGWQLSRHRMAHGFWVFLAASFFFDLGLSIYFFLFNLFLIGHGYTEKTLGLIASAMAAGSFTGAIPAGRFAQRFGLRAALLLAFLLAVLVFSARALLLALPLQLALAFIAGLTLSIWAVCISPAVAHMTTERQRPFAFSLVFSLGIGVGALGGFVGGRLPGWLAQHAGAASTELSSVDPLRLVLLLSCGLVALGLWPVMRLTFERASAVPLQAKPSFLSPFLLRFLPAIAVWGLVTGSFSPFANVYFAEHMRMPLPQIGNAFSASQIMQVVAVLAAPLLFRRLGLVNGIVFTQLAAAVFLCVLAAIHSPLGAALGYMAFTAFQWMNEPGLYSLLMDRVPKDQREGAAASNSLVISASQALAAMLAGAAFARFGYPAPMVCIALVAVVAAALFGGLVRSPRPQTVLELDRVAE